MIKIIKIFSLIFILSIAIACVSGCSLFDRDGGRNDHFCSFNNETTISQLGCTTDGIVISSCLCGLEKVDLQTAYGHSFNQWQMAENPTCSKYGQAIRVCENCDLIQKKVVEKSSHDYIISKEKKDDKEYRRYTCNGCDESFLIDPEVSIPAKKPNDTYLFDCDSNFSFVVISANGREYIENNFKIFDSRFDYPGNETEGLVDYKISQIGHDRWLIKPAKGYVYGRNYRTQHTDGIYFEKYGFSQLNFTINRSEDIKVSVSESVIYLGALEQISPGYYPYSLDFSKESGDYFLSLEKSDYLQSGNIICVGPATCFEDVLNGSGNNTFGRIKSITTLRDGRNMLVLEELSGDELFSALNIYDKSINKIEELPLPIDVERRFKTILMDNEDFASIVSAMYTESREYLENRGLQIGFEEFEDFLNAIKVIRSAQNVSSTADGNSGSRTTASVILKATVNIPAVTMEDNTEVGALVAEVTISVNFEATSPRFQIVQGNDENKSALDLSFKVTEKNSAEFKLDIYSSISYTANDTPFVFEINTRQYHFANCSHIAKETEDMVTKVSVYSMLGLIADSEIISECPHCKPTSSMKKDVWVVDRSTSVYHKTDCRKTLSTPPSNLLFTEEGYEMLSSKGYHACEVCGGNVGKRGSFETEMLDRIKNEDYGEYVDEVIASVIDSDNIKEKLYVGAFSTTLCGIDREIILLDISFNFRLENSTHYSYTINRETTHGFRSISSGILSFVSDYNEEIVAKGFISPAQGDDLLVFNSDISILIAGFTPKISE